MKGIVLAGGSGTRLHPITQGISKQLIPIYDKPMVYYPISILMLAGIRDILIVSTPHDLPQYKRLLGSGKKFGINFSYIEQPEPKGIPQAFILGEDFIGNDNVCLVLGDNVFYGERLSTQLKNASNSSGATIFGYYVNDPERYGVIDFDNDKNIASIHEKPDNPPSNYAVTGLYFYENDVISLSKKLKPSSRGELEITDLNNIYLKEGKLNAEILGRGIAWLDTGTHESLLEANMFVHALESRQGLKIACLEEIAFLNGWIDEGYLLEQADKLGKTSYGTYLKKIIIRKNENL